MSHSSATARHDGGFGNAARLGKAEGGGAIAIPRIRIPGACCARAGEVAKPSFFVTLEGKNIGKT